MFCDYGDELTDSVTDRVVFDHKGDYLLPRKDPTPWN